MGLERGREVANLDPTGHYIFISRNAITWKSVYLTKNALIIENIIVLPLTDTHLLMLNTTQA